MTQGSKWRAQDIDRNRNSLNAETELTEGPAARHRGQEGCGSPVVREPARPDLPVLRSSGDRLTGPLSDREPGRFVPKDWHRDEGRAGRRAHVDHDGPRLREGRRPYLHRPWRILAEFRSTIPGAEEDPRFWASGISLIAHPVNPNVPTVHMNTRMVVTTSHWFGAARISHARAGPAAHAIRPGHQALPSRHGTRLPPQRGGCGLREVQGLVRRLLLFEAPQRAARHRRHLL